MKKRMLPFLFLLIISCATTKDPQRSVANFEKSPSCFSAMEDLMGGRQPYGEDQIVEIDGKPHLIMTKSDLDQLFANKEFMEMFLEAEPNEEDILISMKIAALMKKSDPSLSDDQIISRLKKTDCI